MSLLRALFISIAVLAHTIVCQSPPVFPNQYELAFTEKAKLGPLSGTTTGKIYLDATKNKQLITRQNGYHDRYCGSVHKLTNTPCNHFVVDGIIMVIVGKRFLDFPQKRHCCYCCDSEHGCGIVKTDWLVTANATYQGLQKLEDGKSYVKWSVKGLQDNYYYHAADAFKTPRRLFQVSDDLMDFTSYNIGIKDPNVFNLPSYCTDKCGATTICAQLRGETKSESKHRKEQNKKLWFREN